MSGKFVVSKRKNGELQFVLKAANHQIIGQSEMYSSEAARDNGIDSVRRHAPEAKLVEE